MNAGARCSGCGGPCSGSRALVWVPKDGVYHAHCYRLRYRTPWYRAAWRGLCRAADRAYWWANHRFNPRHRYHVVNTGLPPGYYDCDDLMVAAVAALLVRYARSKAPTEETMAEEVGARREQSERLRELCEYFGSKTPREVLEVPYDEMTEKLCEVIRLRRRVWV